MKGWEPVANEATNPPMLHGPMVVWLVRAKDSSSLFLLLKIQGWTFSRAAARVCSGTLPWVGPARQAQTEIPSPIPPLIIWSYST
jgi:hypothetical protein